MPIGHQHQAGQRRGRRLSLLAISGIVTLLVLGPVLASPGYAPTRAAVNSSSPAPLEPPAALVWPAGPTAKDVRWLRFRALPAVFSALAAAQASLPARAVEPADELWPARVISLAVARPASPEPSAKPRREPTTTQPKETSKPKETPKPKESPEPTKPKSSPKPDESTKPKAPPKPEPSPDFSGKSRFWYPALGIDARWKWYGCEYGETSYGLDKGVYRWGCAGRNNVYLMSHAWSTFRAIQKGYHSGALKVGQAVWYADPKGNVTKWQVKWVKRVKESYFIETFYIWASNSSAKPVMTLQTCDGSRDQYRIIVRLVPAG